MKKFLLLFILPLLATLPAQETSAQEAAAREFSRSAAFPQPPPRPDVLGPSPIIWRLGIDLGLNMNSLKGSYSTPACDCIFENGSGKGALWGAELSRMFSENWGVALKLLVDDMRGTVTKDSTKQYVVWDQQTDQITSALISHERTLDTRLTYLVLNPMLQLYPFGGLYLMAGPAVGIRVIATTEMREKILDDRYTFVNGLSENTIEPATDIPSSEAIRLDLRAGIGYNLKLGRTVIFAPEVSFAYPLSNISSRSDWLVSTFRIVGVLKFEL